VASVRIAPASRNSDPRVGPGLGRSKGMRKKSEVTGPFSLWAVVFAIAVIGAPRVVSAQPVVWTIDLGHSDGREVRDKSGVCSSPPLLDFSVQRS
jgi:hypothetical protein